MARKSKSRSRSKSPKGSRRRRKSSSKRRAMKLPTNQTVTDLWNSLENNKNSETSILDELTGKRSKSGRRKSSSKKIRGPKSSVLNYLSGFSPEDSPYSIGMSNDNHSLSPSSGVELFGKYTPMFGDKFNPNLPDLSRYGSSQYPFAPGSNSFDGFLGQQKGLSERFNNPTDPLLQHLFKLDSEALKHTINPTSTTKLNIQDQTWDGYKINDKISVPKITVTPPQSGGTNRDRLLNNIAAFRQLQSGGANKLFDRIFTGGALNYPYMFGKKPQNYVTLEDIAYTYNPDDEDKVNYIKNNPIMAVYNKDGKNPDKEYMVVKKGY